VAETVQLAPVAPGGPGRFRRVLGAVGASIALAGVFVVALVGSVVLHLDLGPTRRTVRAIANVVFADLFRGKLVVGEIDQIRLSGVRIRGADAWDPGGTQIVHADRLVADVDVLAIVRSVLVGSGELLIGISRVHLDNADVALLRGEGGVPTIADTFLLRGPSTPSEPGGRKARILLDRIEIAHVWAHGDIAPPNFDAEITGAVGHLEVGADGLSIDVQPSHADLRAPLPNPLAGAVTYRLRGAPGQELVMEGGFDGKVGELDVHASGTLSGSRVTGRVEVPHALRGAIASLLPGAPPPIPLRVPVSALIEAEGALPEVAFKTTLSFEDGGTIHAEGTLAARIPLTVDVGVIVHGVDPRVVLDVPSATPIDASGHVFVEVGADTRIDADATTAPFVLAGNTIPKVVASARFAHGVWSATAKVDEIGAPLAATVAVDAQGGVDFDVTAKVASLRAVPRLALPVDGSGTVDVKGTLRDGVLDAHVKARAEGVRAPGSVALTSAGVDARVHGPLAALQVDATVSGKGLRASSYAWDTALIHVRGPLLAPRVDAVLDEGNGDSVSTSGQVDVKGKAVTGLKLTLQRRDGTVHGSVARISAAQGGAKIEGLDLEGSDLGSLKGGLLVVGQELTGKLHGENVDLAKVASLAGLTVHVAGLANVDVDLTSDRPGRRTGHVSLELVSGEALLLKGVSALFTATFDGDHVRTDGLFRVIAQPSVAENALGIAAGFDVAAAFGAVADEPCDGAVARVRFTRGDGELPGPLLDPAAWRRVWGSVELAADEWNLRCIRRMVPFGLPEVRGRLTTRATLERAPGARLPSVRAFFAKTLGLEVADGDWDSLHTDLEIRATVDGDTGVSGAKVSIFDGGLLASASLSATLDLPLLLDQPERRWASLRRAPLSGRIAIPRNKVTAFSGLPSFVTDRVPLITGKNGDILTGEVQVDATLKGTLEDPTGDLKVGAWDLAQATLQQAPPAVAPDKGVPPGAPKPPPKVLAPVLGDWGMPVDVDVHATYDGRAAKLEALHVVHAKHEVLTASGELALLFADILAGKVHPTGSFTARLDQVPLGDVPLFADTDIGGHLSGTLAMTGIGEKPSLHLDLEMPDARVGQDVAYDHTSVKLDIAPPVAGAGVERSASKLEVQVSGPKSGSLTTTVTHGVTWLGGAVPVLDADYPGKLLLAAKGFRVAAAAPFLSAVASRVDGVLDGDASLDWGAPKSGGAARFDGVHLALVRGILNLPQLGQELHDISLTIAGGSDGALAVSNLQARGTKGLITGKGSAHFDGLIPLDAALQLDIKKGDEIPLTLEGVALGDASGGLTVTAKAQNHNWNVKVGIPRLAVELSPSLGRSVISTDDNPDITLRNALRPVDAPVGTRRISISFDPVKVEITGNLQGNTIDAGLVAPVPLNVVIGGKKPRVSGSINITHGRLEVLHKLFEIDEGNIHFHPEDLDKIDVHLTARWDSPDGQIIIEYDGLLSPINAEKIKFRSPTIPADRIISTLLGGADQATPAGGAQSTASAVPGQSLATQLIAQQFSTQIAHNISTSIGTGDDGSIRPGLTYRAGNLSVDVSTYSTPRAQHSLGTVDWRFYRNWVLRGRVDVGSDQQTSGLDLLWQYRY